MKHFFFIWTGNSRKHFPHLCVHYVHVAYIGIRPFDWSVRACITQILVRVMHLNKTKENVNERNNQTALCHRTANNFGSQPPDTSV